MAAAAARQRTTSPLATPHGSARNSETCARNGNPRRRNRRRACAQLTSRGGDGAAPHVARGWRCDACDRSADRWPYQLSGADVGALCCARALAVLCVSARLRWLRCLATTCRRRSARGAGGERQGRSLAEAAFRCHLRHHRCPALFSFINPI
ncbi:hypothetical protein Q1695_006029 [Nippostrongylus brasiliensis]|nr:hypothetical protein Q1695_006029 [Nippostrongylus brasiliensis]